MAFGTHQDLVAVLRPVSVAFPDLLLLVLHGSRARGDSHAHSDWDLAYQAAASFDPDGLLAALAERLNADRIDLVDLDRAGALLRYRVARDGVVLFERDSRPRHPRIRAPRWLAAQEQPDFSARWVLEQPQSTSNDVARALTVRQSKIQTTARGEPMKPFWRELIVAREFADGVRSETYQIGLMGGTVRGTVGGQSPDVPERTTFAVRWRGNQLAIESSESATGVSEPTRWHTELWSLDEQGALVIAISDGHAGADPVARTLRYRRQ